MRCTKAVLSVLMTCALLVMMVPLMAKADSQSQVVKSGWNKIICVVDKDSGGMGLGDYYGWKVTTAVTVTDGIVTDVVTTARGEAMPNVPATEKPYFEPCHYQVEEAIINANISADNPSAIDGIDVVSNATSTAHWIKESTKEALVKWGRNNATAQEIVAKIAAIETAADRNAAVADARAAFDAFDEAASYVPAESVNILLDAEAAIEAEKQAAAEEVDIAYGTVVLAKKSVTYTGKEQKPGVTVKSKSGVVLKNGTDYTVAYKNNTNAGKATVAVTGKGAYSGTKNASFTIAKAAQTVKAAKTYTVKYSKVKNAKQTVTVAFKSTSGGKVTYAAAKTANGKVSIAKNGKVTVKKGTAKGTYTLRVNTVAAEKDNYKKTTVNNVVLKVKVG